MEEQKKSGRGGARPGAGRKKGSTDNVTIKYLLEVLEAKSGGQSYEEILVDDFLTARLNNDTQLMLKYHNLLGNKLFSTLAKVEVVDGEDMVKAKQAAFAEAIAKISGSTPKAK